MPPFRVIEPAQPDPYAGQDTQAFMKILQTLGQGEELRRQKMMSSDILGVLQRGGEPQTIMQNIAGVVQAHQQPTYSSGLQGMLQKIGGLFAPQAGTGIMDMLLKQADPLYQTRLAYYQRQPRTTFGKTLRGEKFHWQQNPTTGEWEKIPVPVGKGAGEVRTSKNVLADINQAMTAVTKAEKLGDEGLQADIQQNLDNLHNELLQMRQRDFPELIGPEHNELFDQVIEGQPKETRWGRWIFSDKVYGSKAYRAAKKAYIKQALQKYKTSPKRAIQQFDKIWLERYQAEAGERFQQFDEPSAFGQEQTPSVSAQADQEAAFEDIANRQKLLEQYKGLGGSATEAGRNFAIESGLLETKPITVSSKLESQVTLPKSGLPAQFDIGTHRAQQPGLPAQFDIGTHRAAEGRPPIIGEKATKGEPKSWREFSAITGEVPLSEMSRQELEQELEKASKVRYLEYLWGTPGVKRKVPSGTTGRHWSTFSAITGEVPASELSLTELNREIEKAEMAAQIAAIRR